MLDGHGLSGLNGLNDLAGLVEEAGADWYGGGGVANVREEESRRQARHGSAQLQDGAQQCPAHCGQRASSRWNGRRESRFRDGRMPLGFGVVRWA